MTTKEFLEQYNYAPYDFDEVAELVSTISDNKDIVNIANAFLEARGELEGMLYDIGFEFG